MSIFRRASLSHFFSFFVIPGSRAQRYWGKPYLDRLLASRHAIYLNICLSLPPSLFHSLFFVCEPISFYKYQLAGFGIAMKSLTSIEKRGRYMGKVAAPVVCYASSGAVMMIMRCSFLGNVMNGVLIYNLQWTIHQVVFQS
jgi:hypothetical protein